MAVESMDLPGAPELEIGHSKEVLFRRTALWGRIRATLPDVSDIKFEDDTVHEVGAP